MNEVKVARRQFETQARAAVIGPASESRTMRAIMLLTDAFGGIGGIAKFNRDVLAALDAMPECQEVEAFPRLVQREPEPIPAKVRYRFEAARGKASYVGAVFRAAMDGRPADVVLCGHLNLLPLAWVVSRFKRCPLVLFVHGIEAWKPHRHRLTRNLLPSVDRVVAVSSLTVERLAEWSGLSVDRTRILPNCVNLAEFYPRPRNEALAARLGIENRRVLLTVGRLAGKDRYKGFDEVLEALPELAREYADVAYVIAGDGRDRPRLEAKARELGVAERVVFTGYVSEEEKKDLYALADVYVMPSRGEGFGIVFLEAMAMGLPVIASRADGSREAILDGRLGQLVDPDDRDELIRTIRAAFRQSRGRPDGLEHFGSDAFRERLADLVQVVARGKRT